MSGIWKGLFALLCFIYIMDYSVAVTITDVREKADNSTFKRIYTDEITQTITAADQNNAAELKGELIFATVMYRHGDRTPMDPYPTDPWGKPEFWPTGWGQLTNIGMQQHFEHGKWLRKRYSKLLSARYDRNEIYVRSTDVDRTLMSAASNLAGMYPPVKDQQWSADLMWQPIPIHTMPTDDDRALAGHIACPAYDYALNALDTTPEFQKLYERLGYLFDYLTNYSGRKVDSFQQVCYLNNTLLIESLYNRTLPEWTKQVYPSADMTFASNFAFVMPTYTRQMARLKVGLLMKEIFERFAQKAEGKLDPDRKLWVYSAHDTTVANVLNTLKLFDPHCPPYAATILLEQRLDANNQSLISIYYKNTTAEPVPMYIPNCGIQCPLSKLFAVYEDILPKDWEAECKLSTIMMTYDQANIGLATGILVAILVTTLLLAYVLMIYYRRRNYRTYLAYSQVA